MQDRVKRVVKVFVDYCKEWGGERNFKKLEAMLKNLYNDDILIEGRVDPNRKGAFEVYLDDRSNLVHSKLNGNGYVDNHKFDDLSDAISERLEIQLK